MKKVVALLLTFSALLLLGACSSKSDDGLDGGIVDFEKKIRKSAEDCLVERGYDPKEMLTMFTIKDADFEKTMVYGLAKDYWDSNEAIKEQLLKNYPFPNYDVITILDTYNARGEAKAVAMIMDVNLKIYYVTEGWTKVK